MHKIGIDIVEISRIKNSVNKYKNKFLDRVFTEKELDYSKNKNSKFSHLAARFCGKEAVMKAFGCAFDFKQIEILNDKEGAPKVKLYGRALKKAKEKKVRNIEISLSHCKQYAVASVILENK